MKLSVNLRLAAGFLVVSVCCALMLGAADAAPSSLRKNRQRREATDAEPPAVAQLPEEPPVAIQLPEHPAGDIVGLADAGADGDDTAQPEPETEPSDSEAAEEADDLGEGDDTEETEEENGEETGEDGDEPSAPETLEDTLTTVSEVFEEEATEQPPAQEETPEPEEEEAEEAADAITAEPEREEAPTAVGEMMVDTDEEQQDDNPWIVEEGINIQAVPFSSENILPVNVRPVHYDLSVARGNRSITGNVDITLHCEVATSSIVFHAQDMKLGQVSITTQNGTDVQELAVVGLGYDTERSQVSVELAAPLQEELEYVLRIGYFEAAVGVSGEGPHKYGYDWMSYEDEIYGATVQGNVAMSFSTPFGRKNFPCFDEPHLTSTFSISMVHKPWMSVFSNMPINHQEYSEEDNFVTSQFQESPPMATRLVELMVADQLWCKQRMWHGTRIRVCARRSQLRRTGLVLKTVPTLIDHMEEFTGIEYPLPKLDYIAIAGYGFRSYPLEHWGIIKGSEYQILFHPADDSVDAMMRINQIVAHELPAQWYSNIFASWSLERKMGTSALLSMFLRTRSDPSWNLDTLMNFEINRNLVFWRAGNADLTQGEHIYNSVAYYKALSIVNLVREALGREAEDVLKGILHKDMFGGQPAENVLAAVSASSPAGIDVIAALNQWKSQPGLPAVSVSLTEEGRVVVTQRNFYEDEANTTSLWPIPLSYVSSEGEQRKFTWLQEDAGVLNVGLPSDGSGWLVLNPGRKGFYRVHYDSSMFQQIVNLLNTSHTTLDEITRAAIIDDASAFALKGELGFGDLSSLMSYINKETDLLPWQVFILNLEQTSKKGLVSDQLAAAIPRLMDDIYNHVGWDVGADEGSASRYLRTMVLTTACHFKHAACMEEALARYRAGDDDRLHPDLRAVVHCTAMSELPAGEGPSLEDSKNFFDREPHYSIPFHCATNGEK